MFGGVSDPAPSLDRRSVVTLTLLAGTAMGYLVWLSWLFFLERTTCYDSAYQLWLMIDAGHLRAEHHRYATMITQLLPVLWVNQGAPLREILLAYSISAVAVPVLVFLLFGFVLRDPRAAVALPLAMMAGTSLAFYMGVSEAYQGIPVAVLFWSVLRKALDAPTSKLRWAWSFAALVASIWSSFYHIVYLLPTLFLLGHELIAGARWKSRSFWSLSAVIVVVFYLHIRISASGYEQERMVGVDDLLTYVPKLFDLASTSYLLEQLPKFKAMAALLFFTVLFSLLTRRWLSLLWVLIYTCGALVLMLIADRDIGSPFMYENQYPLVALVWSVCFAETVVRVRPTFRSVAVGAFGLTLALASVQVWRGHFMTTDKVRYAERLTRTLRGRDMHKAVICMHSVPWKYAHTHWPLPFETALVSALHGPDSTVTVYADMPLEPLRERMAPRASFIGPNWAPDMFRSSALDRRYFALPDTGYRFAAAPFDSLAPRTPMEALSLRSTLRTRRFDPVSYAVVDVHVVNSSAIPLRVVGNGNIQGIQCTLRPVGAAAPVIAQDFTQLEADVPATSTVLQGVTIGRPKEPGRYMAHLELIMDGMPTGVRDSLLVVATRFGL